MTDLLTFLITFFTDQDRAMLTAKLISKG